MSQSYKVTPIYSLNSNDFDSFEKYEEQYEKNCSFVEYIILSKHIPLYDRINAITNKMELFDGYLSNILNAFCSKLTFDFVIFDDGHCGFIKPNGDWIKINVDKSKL